nr:hypothetical protein [Tanacetum cinerariifolium]
MTVRWGYGGGSEEVTRWCRQWYGEMRGRGGVVVLWFVEMEMVGPTRGGGGGGRLWGWRWWIWCGYRISPEMGGRRRKMIYRCQDCLEVSVSNKQSGNPTFSLQKEITSPEVTHEFYDSDGCTFLSEELPDIDSFNDIK